MIKNSPKDIQIDVEKLNGFYRGVVENNNDSLKAGRVQVRIFGLHTPKKTKSDIEGIPTEDLPWAEPCMPIHEGSVSGFGAWAVPLQGSQVMLFFENGNPSQPRYFASMPGIPEAKEQYYNSNNGSSKKDGFRDPDNEYPVKNRLGEPDFHRLARGVSNETLVTTKNQQRDVGIPTALGGNWSEPSSPYNTQYPHNHVIATHGGITIELDSTPGSTRLNLYHPSNSFIEIDNDGNMVVKNNAEKYEIVTEGKNIHIKQQRNLTIDDYSKKKIANDEEIEVGGDKEEKVDGDFTQTIDGNKTETIGEDKSETIGENKISDITDNKTVTIGGNKSESIDGNKTVQIDGNQTENTDGNKIETVGGSKSETIGTSKSETVGTSKTQNIGSNKSETIGGSKTETITGAKTETIGGGLTITVTGNANITATGNANITAAITNILGVVNLAAQGALLPILTSVAATVFNSHTHNENGDGGGVTDPPNQSMGGSTLTTNTKAS